MKPKWRKLFLSARLTRSCKECAETSCLDFDLKNNIVLHELIEILLEFNQDDDMVRGGGGDYGGRD